jgi:hypothetical protein
MRRREFITLVVLSGEEKKAWAAGCDDYVPNPSVHHNCWRKFAFPGNSGGVDCRGARVCLWPEAAVRCLRCSQFNVAGLAIAIPTAGL